MNWDVSQVPGRRTGGEMSAAEADPVSGGSIWYRFSSTRACRWQD